MVSKFEHCLNDLLFRARIGELPIDIVGVVSNHPDHRGSWNGTASPSSMCPSRPTRSPRPKTG